jgi:hypothetical protein
VTSCFWLRKPKQFLLKLSVIAVRERGERQSVKRRCLGHVTVDEDGGGEGDPCSQMKETLGELEGRIDMALCGKCYKEDVRMHHDGYWLSLAIDLMW